MAHKKPHFQDFYLFLIFSKTFDSEHRFPWSWYRWIVHNQSYPTIPRSWKTMVGIKSYTQNKEEVKISKVRFFMGHPVHPLPGLLESRIVPSATFRKPMHFLCEFRINRSLLPKSLQTTKIIRFPTYLINMIFKFFDLDFD